MIVCETVYRLKTLQPGQSITFYKGDIPKLSEDSKSPTYDRLLIDIYIAARALATIGQIRLHTEPIEIELPEWKAATKGYGPCRTTAHVATGLLQTPE